MKRLIAGMLAWVGVACCQSPQPVITAVVDSASYAGSIAWGELVTIFGQSLSDGGIYQAQSVALPKQLGSTQVFAGTEAMELLYVSPGQLNLRMSTAAGPPTILSGISLTVKVGGLTSAIWGNGYNQYAPALFSSGFDCPYTGWPNAGATNVQCGLSGSRLRLVHCP